MRHLRVAMNRSLPGSHDQEKTTVNPVKTKTTSSVQTQPSQLIGVTPKPNFLEPNHGLLMFQYS
jgi:hypothetical protein